MVRAGHNLHLVFFCLLCLLCSSCRQDGKALLFHAGAGQRSSLDEIKTLFEKKNPGVSVNFSYKGSGYFIADITRSREGDLYMPGEEFYLLQAVERGFISTYVPERDIAAYFVTVIITPKGNPKKITSIEDFAKPGVRVGLGNPKACAIGVWHEKTFKRAGIWEKVRNNATMSAKCIPELGNAIQHQAIDATIVWSTTAILYMRDVEIIPLAPKYRGVVSLPVAVLNFARLPSLANKMKAFILSGIGQEVFRKHAYATKIGDVDKDGFCNGKGPTDQLMHWLTEAADVVKQKNLQVTDKTVGPFVDEVLRQRATK